MLDGITRADDSAEINLFLQAMSLSGGNRGGMSGHPAAPSET